MIPMKSKQQETRCLWQTLACRKTHIVCVRVCQSGESRGAADMVSCLSCHFCASGGKSVRKRKKKPTLPLNHVDRLRPTSLLPPRHRRRKQTSFVFPALLRLPQIDTSQQAA